MPHRGRYGIRPWPLAAGRLLGSSPGLSTWAVFEAPEAIEELTVLDRQVVAACRSR
jgi:hypothetical protein